MQGGPWTMGRVPGEVDLAVGRAGAGEPVVLLHGITAQHRAFNALARELADRRTLFGVDLRGRGDSEKPDGGYGLDGHAADVVRVLDHLGLGSAVLAGHSMGAFVALRVALDYPRRVRALLLIDGGWPRPEGEGTGGGGEAVREGLERAFSRLTTVFAGPREYLDFWFPGQGLGPEDLPPDLADYYLYDLERTAEGYRPKCLPAAARADAEAVTARTPTLEEMRSVRCPVALVLAAEGFSPGTEPLVSGETAARMASSLDVRREVRVPGANHYTVLWPEHVGAWAGVLRERGWYAPG